MPMLMGLSYFSRESKVNRERFPLPTSLELYEIIISPVGMHGWGTSFSQGRVAFWASCVPVMIKARGKSGQRQACNSYLCAVGNMSAMYTHKPRQARGIVTDQGHIPAKRNHWRVHRRAGDEYGLRRGHGPGESWRTTSTVLLTWPH